MNWTSYESVFVVTFFAASDGEAEQVALQHHGLLRDRLQVEGADHPRGIRLERLHANGRDLLDAPREKAL